MKQTYFHIAAARGKTSVFKNLNNAARLKSITSYADDDNTSLLIRVRLKTHESNEFSLILAD